jgi:hypothetical protein
MQGDAEILTCGPVGAGQNVQAHADLVADGAVGEVEHPVKLYLVAVEDPREQRLYSNRLAFAEPLEFSDGARAALAEIKHREASWWVEAPAVKTRALAAQRIIVGPEMSKASTGERPERWRGYSAKVVDHMLTR